MMQTRSPRPYWLWRHGGSRLPQLSHLALDGKVIRADTPEGKAFWIQGGMYPPIGFGCQCKTFSLSRADLEDGDYEEIDPPEVGKAIRFRDENGVDRDVVMRAAEGYARLKDSPVLLSLLVSAKNPKVFQDSLDFSEFLDENKIPFDNNEDRAVTEVLRSQGFDAIQIISRNYVVVFDPTQIAVFHLAEL